MYCTVSCCIVLGHAVICCGVLCCAVLWSAAGTTAFNERWHFDDNGLTPEQFDLVVIKTPHAQVRTLQYSTRNEMKRSGYLCT